VSRVRDLWAEVDALRVALAAAEAKLATFGMVELAVRNPNVSSYITEWEGRALRAEAALADERRQLTAALEAERLHADALADGHRVVCAEGGRGNRDAALNCMETATRLLAAHAARRAAAAPLSDAGASSEVARG
jgi:hypothetical protein